jgi:putative selenium metabolism hydrolase
MVNPFSSIGSVSLMKLALNAEEKREMTGFLQGLVQMPSPSGQEKAVAGLLKEGYKAAGVQNVHIDKIGNVVAELGSGSGPTLVINGHMDTVAPAVGEWKHDPYSGHVADGYLHGVGSCDMKGSLAAMVYAAKRLTASNVELKGRLIFLSVVQEEPCEGSAMQAWAAETGITPDYVLLGEPSDMGVMLGHRGRVLMRVTVHGKSSHASQPHLGYNAITAAARLLFGIEMMAADLPDDPSMGPGSVAVTDIDSDAPSMNAVPHRCSFVVDRRLTLGETPSRALSQIEAIIEREGLNAEVEIITYDKMTYSGYGFHVEESFDAWALDAKTPLAAQLKTSVRAVCGEEPHTGYWQFSTDGVFSMGVANIPTVGFGPGDPTLAHAAGERVKLDDVAAAAQVYAAFAALVLNA